MKKIMRVLLTMVLALSMVLGMSIGTFAADTSTLTITNTEEGKTIYAFKLFNIAESTDEYYTSDAIKTYTLNDDFYEFFKGYYNAELADLMMEETTNKAQIKEKIVELAQAEIYGTGDKAGQPDQGTALVKALVNEVAEKESKYIKIDDVTEITTTKDTTTVAGMPQGFYFLYPKGASDTTSVQTTAKVPGMLVDLTKDATIAMKSAYPTVTKTFADGEEATTAQIGDDVNFKLVGYVPDMTGYKGYTYYFKDELCEGLTLKKDANDVYVVTVKVAEDTDGDGTIGDEDIAAAKTLTASTQSNYLDGDYSVQVLTNGGFAVVMNQFYTKYHDKTGAQIIVEYTAVLNEKAAINFDANTNKATVNYSTDPSKGGKGILGNEDTPKVPTEDPDDPTPKNPDPDDPDTPTPSTPDEAKVYTIGFDLHKYAYHGNDQTTKNLLAGAEFVLKDEDGVTIKLFKVDDNTYRLATDKDTDTTDTIVTNDTKDITINGLAAGTYSLEETEAPTGYNKLTQKIELKVKADFDDTDTSKLRQTSIMSTLGTKTPVTSTKSFDDTDKTHVINVENKWGSILPNTGSTGTILFTIIGGAVLVFMFGSSLYSRKKK